MPSRRGAEKLLCSAFETAELRRLVKQEPALSDLARIDWSGGIEDVVERLLDAAIRRGLLPDLWSAVRGALPNRAAEIDDAARWTPGQPAASDDAFREKVRRRADSLPAIFQVPCGPKTFSAVRVQVVAAHDHAPLEVHELLPRGTRQWVIRGAPGTGKTCLLHHLAMDLCAGQHGGRLPVLLRIAEIEAGTSLRRAIERSYALDDATPIVHALRDDRAVLLLDGLDEAVDLPAARSLVSSYAAEVRSPVLLTSRTIGYASPDGEFGEVDLMPLSEDAQRGLLRNWGIADDVADEALARLHVQRRMREIAENPLLLTIAAMVLRDGGKLPERRVDLYDEAIDACLRGAHHHDARAATIAEPDRARQILARLALAGHAKTRGGAGRDLLDPATLSGLLRGEDLAAWGRVDGFLADVGRLTGLLAPERERRRVVGWFFPHRTFREHLAGEALAADLERLPEVLAEAVTMPALWSEVLALAGTKADDADGVLEKVLDTGSQELVLRVLADAEGVSDVLVDRALGMTDDVNERRMVLQDLPTLVPDARVVVQLLDRLRPRARGGDDLFWIRYVLDQVLGGALPMEADVRAMAERARAALFDHLDGTGVVEALQPRWRPIPPSGDPPFTFLMGSPETEEGQYDWEGPQHPCTITARFHMTDVPVMNALYRRFDQDHDLNAPANHPVANVSWYAATMFAAWVTAMVRRNPALTGVTMRLPTEEEWEFACRAGTTTRFWSGDDDADLFAVGWVDHNGGGHTHAIDDLPPRGDEHPWGLRHLHGNVWEWCAEEHAEDLEHRYPRLAANHTHDPTRPIDLGDPRARRPFRGGCWGVDPQGARSAFRGRVDPWFHLGLHGFRLVWVGPSPSPGASFDDRP